MPQSTTSYAIQAPRGEFRSSYLPDPGDPSEKQPDRETLEAMAALMGIDLEAIQEKIEEQKRLSAAAWKKKRKRRDQWNSGVVSFMELVNFDGKQLFWSLAGDNFIVQAHGETFSEPDMDQALHRLACA